MQDTSSQLIFRCKLLKQIKIFQILLVFNSIIYIRQTLGLRGVKQKAVHKYPHFKSNSQQIHCSHANGDAKHSKRCVVLKRVWIFFILTTGSTSYPHPKWLLFITLTLMYKITTVLLVVAIEINLVQNFVKSPWHKAVFEILQVALKIQSKCYLFNLPIMLMIAGA